jgi:electron transport complex protein RnfB
MVPVKAKPETWQWDLTSIKQNVAQAKNISSADTIPVKVVE